MDFAPDPDHVAIAEAVDRVCADFDDDYWLACGTEHRFPTEFYDAMAAGGWLGIAIPERYGGGGTGIAEAAVVLNRVAASGAAMNGSTEKPPYDSATTPPATNPDGSMRIDQAITPGVPSQPSLRSPCPTKQPCHYRTRPSR